MRYVINPEPKELIKQYIPVQVRSVFSKEITDAYKWSEIIVNNTAAFRTLRGKKKLLPEVKNLAVEFLMIQAVKSGRLPFNCRTGYNSNHSHSFLELYNDDLLIHFNQVKNKSSCGRKAACRERLMHPVQSYIDYNDDNVFISNNDPKYFQVNHGYQSATPLFISLGIPNSHGKLEGYLSLLEEFALLEGAYPVSQVNNIDDFSFEEFQRYAEGEEDNVSKQSS